MQTSFDDRQNQSIKDILMALLLGLVVGFIVFGFFKALYWIELQHEWLNRGPVPFHLIGLPFCLIFLSELRKRTLYFPQKVSELTKKNIEHTQHWNSMMTLFHFVGTALSHLVGASVGREGTAVMMASGIVRLFRLSWNYWGPIAVCVGFSSVVGQPWVALVLMYELFSTSMMQKILTLIAATVAYLVLKTLHVPHLFEHVSIVTNPSFWQKLFFIIFIGVLAGLIMKYYKRAFYCCSYYFKSSRWFVKFFVAVLLAVFLAQPMLRKFQSLGLFQLDTISQGVSGWLDVAIKLFVTLISVTLGFWGGEFIPLVYAGLHFGNMAAQFFQFDIVLGTMLGCYLFFAGATRLKWTSYVLTLSLLGWSWWFWSYVLMSITVQYSGPASLYKEED